MKRALVLATAFLMSFALSDAGAAPPDSTGKPAAFNGSDVIQANDGGSMWRRGGGQHFGGGRHFNRGGPQFNRGRHFTEGRFYGGGRHFNRGRHFRGDHMGNWNGHPRRGGPGQYYWPGWYENNWYGSGPCTGAGCGSGGFYNGRWVGNGWYGGGWYGNGWYGGGGALIGALIGTAIANDYYRNSYNNSYGNSHAQWCANRYRSYSPQTDTYQPNNGPRRRCISPYN